MDDIQNRTLEAVQDRDLNKLKLILDSLTSVWNHLGGNDYSLLHHLCECRWSEGLELALSYRESIDFIDRFDDFSWTPLIIASRENDLNSVKMLLECGAGVNAHEEAKIGNTALIEAVDAGNEKIVDLLLLHGADPAITGWMQMNAFDKAKYRFEKSGNPVDQRILRAIEKGI